MKCGGESSGSPVVVALYGVKSYVPLADAAPMARGDDVVTMGPVPCIPGRQRSWVPPVAAAASVAVAALAVVVSRL